MLFDKPSRVFEDEEDSWLLVESNRAFKLQKYRYGGIGKGIRTIQSILTMAKIVHRSPTRGATPDIPWDYRIVSVVPVPARRSSAKAKSGELHASGDRGAGSETEQSHCWQLAGSNNLFHARRDLEALVLKLNSMLTEMEVPSLSTAEAASQPQQYWQPGNHDAVLSLLGAVSEVLKGQPELRPNLCLSDRSFEHEAELGATSAGVDSFTAASSDWSDIMILVIFVVLPPSNLLMCAQVSKSWNKMASHDALWKGHLHHLNQTLGIMESEHMDQLVGKMVVDGMVTYKYLYTATFVEAVRRRNSQPGDNEADSYGLHDVGEHDMRRVLFKGLYGVTSSMGGGLKELGKGIQEAGGGMAVGAVEGLLLGGSMAARMGSAAPGPDVTRRALSVGGGVLGGVGGAVTGTIVGVASAMPSVLRGCVGKPLGGLADLLQETGNMIRTAPEEIMGSTAHEFGSAENEDDKTCQHPGGVGTGLSTGFQALQRELGGGVGSLYNDPLQGAEESGVEGILVGSGRGALKIVCKPVAGTILLGGAVARGISNSTNNDIPCFSRSAALPSTHHSTGEATTTGPPGAQTVAEQSAHLGTEVYDDTASAGQESLGLSNHQPGTDQDLDNLARPEEGREDES